MNEHTWRFDRWMSIQLVVILSCVWHAEFSLCCVFFYDFGSSLGMLLYFLLCWCSLRTWIPVEWISITLRFISCNFGLFIRNFFHFSWFCFVNPNCFRNDVDDDDNDEEVNTTSRWLNTVFLQGTCCLPYANVSSWVGRCVNTSNGKYCQSKYLI